jgi:NADH-quinone oxidoreductase subunit C
MHDSIVSFLNSKISSAGAVANIKEVGDSSITVAASAIKSVCTLLRDSADHEFNVLQVITGVDYPEKIEVNYVLASFTKNTELIVKAELEKSGGNCPQIDSVVEVWKAANYQERECYDLMGVDFVGHPDLRRILCPEDWEGYPLRKDYKAPESYNGMVIYPEEKMNNADREFKDKLKAESAPAPQ